MRDELLLKILTKFGQHLVDGPEEKLKGIAESWLLINGESFASSDKIKERTAEQTEFYRKHKPAHFPD